MEAGMEVGNQRGREGCRDGDIEAGSEVLVRRQGEERKKERRQGLMWGWMAAWCKGGSVGEAGCQGGRYKQGDKKN